MLRKGLGEPEKRPLECNARTIERQLPIESLSLTHLPVHALFLK